jgi:ABC-type dipeptide/oligopeptide/nickel transport system permease subunit
VLRFLRENWIWIAAPIVLLALLVAAAVILGAGESSPFDYPIR